MDAAEIDPRSSLDHQTNPYFVCFSFFPFSITKNAYHSEASPLLLCSWSSLLALVIKYEIKC